MARFRTAVHITPRKGLLDPQGQAVQGALQTLGFDGVNAVHIGRYIIIESDSADAISAEEEVAAMCAKLLANPVTEDFENRVGGVGMTLCAALELSPECPS